MTGPEHYQAAEELIDQAAADYESHCEVDARFAVSRAQVHATLALAAATGVNSSGKEERREWQYVAGVEI